MKVLALDVGDARIGLAVGETGHPWVFGRGYLVRTNLDKDIQALEEKARGENATAFVVGLPLRTDGTVSLQQQRVLPIVERLEAGGWKIFMQDERYTTKLGQARLQNAPKRVREEKGKLDEASAVAILESFLARPHHE